MASLAESRKQLVEHYARMALIPGWVPYARHQIQEVLEKDPSGNWDGLYLEVKQRMKEIENDTK
jgi:hypothetical protein